MPAIRMNRFQSAVTKKARMKGIQHDLIEFTLLKAYLGAGRLEEARWLLHARHPGASGVPAARSTSAASSSYWVASFSSRNFTARVVASSATWRKCEAFRR
jgi:hypothetical protein